MAATINKIISDVGIRPDSQLVVELEKMYSLARNGRVHTENRQKSIRSHIKDVFQHFSAFTYDEFYNYVFHCYVKSLLKGKKFSRAYLLNKLNTIKRLSRTRYFGKRDVARIIGNIDKMINPMARTNQYYTNRGQEVLLDDKLIDSLRDVNKNRMQNTKSFRLENDLVVSPLYTSNDCEFLLEHFSNHLTNFMTLPAGTQPSVHDELALVITFMGYSPRRINEIIMLTDEQWDDLIMRQMTTIQSKSTICPTTLLVPLTLATILQNYRNVVTVEGTTTTTTTTVEGSSKTLVIKSTYQQLLKTLKDATAALLNRRVERPFHGFRNYFAYKYKKVDYQNTRRALDHASGRVTSMYANKQRRQNANVDTLDFLNKCSNVPSLFTTSSEAKC